LTAVAQIKITCEMLRVYLWYRGDVDIFARDMWVRSRAAAARAADPAPDLKREEMPDEAWKEITLLLQSLGMVERGLTSPGFAAEVYDSLAGLAADPAAREEILRIARTRADLVGGW
jgi:hypothetical protein